MRFHGRARLSRRHPEASGVCDLCGTRVTRTDLEFQYDWQGLDLVNKRVLRCNRCLDEPSPKNRTLRIPPDNIPVKDPRPVSWARQEVGGMMFMENGHMMQLETGSAMYLESY